MNKQGEMDSKNYPLYIHFKAECPKEYVRPIQDVHYEALFILGFTFEKDTLARLPEEVEVLK